MYPKFSPKPFLNALCLFAVVGALFTASIYAQSCPGGAGCLDPTFGTGGKLTYQSTSPAPAPMDMVTLPDGKILELIYRTAFLRLNADGTLDQTFGTGGVAAFSWPAAAGLEQYAYGKAMRLQDVGAGPRIVVAGVKRLPSGRNSFVQVLQVGRFMLDGTGDPSFGTNGTVLINAATFAKEMEIQADGKIVVMDNNGKVVRTNADGSLDTGFGSGGFVNATYNNDVAIDGNGGILVGGEYTIGSGKNTKMMMGVKRYTSGGTLDIGFGNAGTATADFNVKSVTFGNLVFDPFGNIVAAGGVVAPGNGQWYFSAARFTSNGLVDTSFGGTGKVKFLGAAGMEDRGALVQSDGKVVLLGSLNDNYGLARYNFDGTLDTTFGNAGSTIEDVDLTDRVKTWVMQTDPACACNKIVMSSAGIGVSFARFTVQ